MVKKVILLLVGVATLLLALTTACVLESMEGLERTHSFDPGSPDYQGYHTVDHPDQVQAHITEGAQILWPEFVVSEVLGATGYQLQIAADRSFPEDAILYHGEVHQGNVMQPSRDLGFAAGTPYYWRGRAIRISPGAWTEPRSFTMESATGMSPVNDETYEANTRPGFSWGEVEGAVSYEIQIADSAAGVAAAEGVSTTTPAYTPEAALTNNHTHYWRVRAVNTDGHRSGWSRTFSVTISWGAISGMSPADGSTTTDARPVVRWDAVDGATGYQLQFALSSGAVSGADLQSTSATSVSFPFDLEAGDIAYWRVRAVVSTETHGLWSMVHQLRFEQIPVPQDGLLSEYLFAGNAVDTSGNGNHGIVDGATLIEDRFDRSGQAYYFDGTGSSILLPATTINREFSISGWIRIDDISKSNILYSERTSHGNGADDRSRVYVLRTGNGDANWPNRLVFHIRTKSGAWNDYDGYSVVTQNQYHSGWIHVVAIRDYGSLRIWVNGDEQDTQVNVDYHRNANLYDLRDPTNDRGYIGALWARLLYFGHGGIDDVRIYSRVLAPHEVQSLYTR